MIMLLLFVGLIVFFVIGWVWAGRLADKEREENGRTLS